jgi:predicted nucleotidyltransferase
VGTDQITAKVRAIMPELQKLGVTDLRLFGSHVRGEATDESDVDLLVSMTDANYATYCKILDRLEAALGRKVDLVMVEALKPAYRERVLNEAVRVA